MSQCIEKDTIFKPIVRDSHQGQVAANLDEEFLCSGNSIQTHVIR